MKWFVLYTKPHHELKVANNLRKIGIRTYCPVFNQIKQYSDRKKKVEKPLLQSYVLVKIEDKERKEVFNVAGVVRYLYWLGKPAIVREHEVEMMEKYLSGVYQDLLITKIKKGINCVLEIVIDGLSEKDISTAMKKGIDVIVKYGSNSGVKVISAGNYGGKLGPYLFKLKSLIR